MFLFIVNVWIAGGSAFDFLSFAGMCRNFDVHVLGNSQLLKMCILTWIERMSVCAFLPVRVREFVLFVLVLSWAC